MSLVKRKNSQFWYVQFQIDNRTVVRSTRTSDRKVAERVAAKIREEVHAEIFLGRKRAITFEEALARYAEAKTGQASHRNVVSQIRVILGILSGQIPLRNVDQLTLEQFRRSRFAQGCAPQTVKHGMSVIVGAVRLAACHGYETASIEPPAIRVPNSRLRYLSRDEERRLLAELDPKRECAGLAPIDQRDHERARQLQDNYDLVVLLLDTGARYSELANIRWQSIDLRERSIRLWRPKVQNESVLFMTERTYSILARRWETRASEYVFSSKSMGPRGYSAIAIRKAMNRAALSDCSIHTLRHTHATRLIQNGLNVYEVRAVLGHTDIRTTMRYAHLEQAEVTSRARDIIDGLNAAGPPTANPV